MQVILLAGGFAKRMWPLTKDKPKHLLPIAGIPMLSYNLKKLEENSEISKVYISTNAKFEDNFREFIEEYKKESKLDLELIIEDTLSEGEKLGSVGALGMIIKAKNIDEELLVIGGDNIFSFKVEDFLNYVREKGMSGLAAYDVGSLELAKKYGILKVDENNKIIDFVEKPENPPSTLSSCCFFYFTKEDVTKVKKYLDEGNSPDSMGYFIDWLYQHSPMCAFTFSEYWFDIGSFEELDRVNEFFSKKE